MAFLEVSDNQDSDGNIKVNGLSMASTSKSSKHSIANSMEKIKTVVTFESEFEQRDKFISLTSSKLCSEKQDSDAKR